MVGIPLRHNILFAAVLEIDAELKGVRYLGENIRKALEWSGKEHLYVIVSPENSNDDGYIIDLPTKLKLTFTKPEQSR